MEDYDSCNNLFIGMRCNVGSISISDILCTTQKNSSRQSLHCMDNMYNDVGSYGMDTLYRGYSVQMNNLNRKAAGAYYTILFVYGSGAAFAQVYYFYIQDVVLCLLSILILTLCLGFMGIMELIEEGLKEE